MIVPLWEGNLLHNTKHNGKREESTDHKHQQQKCTTLTRVCLACEIFKRKLSERKWRKEKTKCAKPLTAQRWYRTRNCCCWIRGVRGGIALPNAFWKLVTMARGDVVSIIDVKAVLVYSSSVEARTWKRASCATRHVSVACGGEALFAHGRAPRTTVPRVPLVTVNTAFSITVGYLSFWSRHLQCCRRWCHSRPHRSSSALCHHQGHGTRNAPPPVSKKRPQPVTRNRPSFLKHRD